VSTTTVTQHLDAPIDAVFAAVGDPATIARLSPELQRITWLDGAGGPAVGARYRGINRNGPFLWATVSTITAFDPPHVVAHEVGFLGRTFSRWRYELSAAPDGGTTVTASTDDLRPAWFARVSVLGTGVVDRPARNRDNLAATLRALADQLESRSAGSA
jgi:uncharacterized protein YndB with AHSA1/START domain